MGGQVLGAIFNIFKTDFFAELPEMQEFLKLVVDNEWYPVEKLKICVKHIREKDQKILNDIGRSWARRGLSALGDDSNLSPKDVLLLGFSQYKMQHRGTVKEVGTVVCTEDPANENKVIISDYSIYRCDIILYLFLTLVEESGGRNVAYHHPDQSCRNKGFPYCRYEITWD
ncbi:MAG: hypothetical protein GY762_11205 [Proteobacteria bacterium]|nr:hypothetical protein [Pseudomonadota bacterium]